MRRIAAAGLAIGLMAPGHAAVAQESPPPLGLWRGTASGDALWIRGDGECSASGSINISGSCTWDATATGGILTMTYPWVTAPGHIYWSIRWLKWNVILVNNVEKFVKQSQ